MVPFWGRHLQFAKSMSKMANISINVREQYDMGRLYTNQSTQRCLSLTHESEVDNTGTHCLLNGLPLWSHTPEMSRPSGAPCELFQNNESIPKLVHATFPSYLHRAPGKPGFLNTGLFVQTLLGTDSRVDGTSVDPSTIFTRFQSRILGLNDIAPFIEPPSPAAHSHCAMNATTLKHFYIQPLKTRTNMDA